MGLQLYEELHQLVEVISASGQPVEKGKRSPAQSSVTQLDSAIAGTCRIKQSLFGKVLLLPQLL
jgi:hypothetical protein